MRYPRYPNQSPFPIEFYEWKCPICGDVCSDPQSVKESMCHNGHEVLLVVTDDGAYEEMIALPPFRK